jgi:hypothetical protein
MSESARGSARNQHDVDILAVDLGFHQSGNQLDDLLAGLPIDTIRIRRLNPLPLSWRTGRDLLGLNAEGATEALQTQVGRRTVLVGYCAGAAFAMQLLAAFERTLSAPSALVLASPTLVTRASIDGEIDALICQLGGGYSAHRLTAELPSGPVDAEVFSALVDRRLRPLAVEQAARLEVDPTTVSNVVEGIVGWYVDWTSFLFAALSVAEIRLNTPVYVVGEAEDGVIEWVRQVSPSVELLDRQDAPAAIADIVAAASR